MQNCSGPAAPGEGSAAENWERLMEAGYVHLEGEVCQQCLVTRSMPVISADGEQVGWVAAVTSADRGQPASVLLAHPETTLQYYLLTPAMIARVADGKVLLRVSAQAARGRRHGHLT